MNVFPVLPNKIRHVDKSCMQPTLVFVSEGEGEVRHLHQINILRQWGLDFTELITGCSLFM